MTFIILSLQTNDGQFISEDFSNTKHGVYSEEKYCTTSPNEKRLEIFRGRNGQDRLSGLRGKMDLLDQKETQEFLVLKEMRQVE